MWPGRRRSRERVRGFASAFSVRARSKAEVPVVVPRRASTDSVKGVPNLAVLRDTMSFKPRRSAHSADMGAHRMPRPCLSMKFTVSGVAFSAAHTRSPSFSRSASSTTTMICPARIRRTASGTVRKTPRAAALAERRAGRAARPACARSERAPVFAGRSSARPPCASAPAPLPEGRPFAAGRRSFSARARCRVTLVIAPSPARPHLRAAARGSAQLGPPRG